MSYKIITDSCCDLAELAQELATAHIVHSKRHLIEGDE